MENNRECEDRMTVRRPFRMSFFALIFALILSSFQTLSAQNRKLEGTVFDEQGEPVIGATIRDLSSKRTTTTNIDGKFTLQIPENATINVTYIGCVPQNITVNSKTTFLKITLKPKVQELEETVVTALGIRRDAKSLTYGRQTVKMDDEMTQTRDANLLNMLQGKVSGVQIISGGGPGSSTRVVIRGNNSITGNNQPLYVIDGIPIMNDMGENGELDYGNAAANINPDDIESIEILKGANASALYGSDGANGVILITTKKAQARAGWGVSFSSNVQLSRLYQYPAYQNIYGSGMNAEINQNALNMTGKNGLNTTYNPNLPWGIFNLTSQDASDRSYGLPMLGFPIIGRGGELRSYSPNKNNISDLYKTGIAWTNSLSFDKVTDKASIRFSYTVLTANDVVKDWNERTRHSFNLRTQSKLTDRLTADVNASYTYDAMDNRGYRNSSSRNPLFILGNLPRDTSVEELIPWKDGNGKPFNLNGGFTNPYWLLYELPNHDTKHWFMGNITLNYRILNYLNFRLRIATDLQTARGWEYTNMYSQFDTDGQFKEFSQMAQNNNIEAMLNFNKRFKKDWNLTASMGYSWQHRRNERTNLTVGTTSQPDMPSLANNGAILTGNDSYDGKEKVSVFAMANVGYKDMVYLDGTVRNDWSSTLSPGNNSYSYWSTGLSFILTQAFEIPKEILTFGKLRGSVATVGNDAPFDSLYDGLNLANTYLGMPYYMTDNTRKNPNLKPEQTTSYEVGADFRFWNNRISVDFTYYWKSTTDQIMRASVSSASGYRERFVNAGEIQNRGAELTASITPVKTKNFEWTTIFNWSKNNSKIVSLTPGVDRYQVRAAGADGCISYVEVGKPYGQMYGTDWQRDAAGNVIADSSGKPLEQKDVYIGHVEPDFLGGWKNQFRYKGFDFSFLFDFKKGGLFYSETAYKGNNMGNSIKSLEGRDEYFFSKWVLDESDQERAGYLRPTDVPFPADNLANRVPYMDGARPKGVYFPGRVFEASIEGIGGHPVVNDWVKPDVMFCHISGRNAKMNTYDATYVKLREVALGYTFPKKLLRKTPFQSLRLSAVGRNLAILFQNTPQGIDPEATSTTGNGQGFEQGYPLPTATYGFDLKVTF